MAKKAAWEFVSSHHRETLQGNGVGIRKRKQSEEEPKEGRLSHRERHVEKKQRADKSLPRQAEQVAKDGHVEPGKIAENKRHKVPKHKEQGQGHQQLAVRVNPTNEKGTANGPQRSLSALQRKMQAKLDGAHFRYLNEMLYSSKGCDAFANIQSSPELFHEYHRGYEHQVQSWPCNPLDKIIQMINSLEENKVVADFGCGTAELSRNVKQKRVYSFDLVAANERVTACDIAHVPLGDESVDIVVFCLSLMGTNYADFIQEAFRVLKPGGKVIIAEVSSRFEDSNPLGDKPKSTKSINDPSSGHPSQTQKHFVQAMESNGFQFKLSRDIERFFLMLLFVKMLRQRPRTESRKRLSHHRKFSTKLFPPLKACIYKRR